MSNWIFSYPDYKPERERLRETLCTLGNGYFATRGAAPEVTAAGHHYPGTYVAGIYNRLATDISGQTVENESLVNAPNWLPLRFRTSESWFHPDGDEYELLEHHQRLDLQAGLLVRHLKIRDAEGRTTAVTQRRFVNMRHAHLAGLQTTFEAEDWSGTIHVESGLDGRVTNSGVERYNELDSDHLDTLRAEVVSNETILLEVATNGSAIRLAEAARTTVRGATPTARDTIVDDEYVAEMLELPITKDEPVTVDKIVSLYTSRDPAIYEPAVDAVELLEHAASFEELASDHRIAWDRLWERYNLNIEDGRTSQLIVRLHVFHLLQTASDNTIDLDVGVPARGLHGEAYRGHIFWDEVFIFPLINFRTPILTRSFILYRHRRLPQARWAAERAGHRGACFPWQSSSNGREESQSLHLNPKSGRWLPDHSYLQRHINLAIAINAWQYYEVTDDLPFMRYHGAPLLIEIARFMASLATYNPSLDRYEIRNVMGPDEFHDAYPDSDEPGLNNNAYTNVLTAWLMQRVLELAERMAPYHREEIGDVLGVTRRELDEWDDLSRKLHIPFLGSGVIAQFDGYGDLEEFDWQGYRERYGDIQRLDRILEAEGDSPNRYQLSKQADVLMLFYLLSERDLGETLDRLGYDVPDDLLERNAEFYLARTSHGSTLSKVVHAWVLAKTDRSTSWKLFLEALESDVADVQGGTTEEGIHLGAMAGTVDLLERCYTGLEARGGALRFDPRLPEQLRHLDFEMNYRGQRIHVTVTHEHLALVSRAAPAPPIEIEIYGQRSQLVAGTRHDVDLSAARDRDLHP